eukprot:SAG22_NODE_809_length_7067_cov_5.261768_3_plen_76_part_00
MEPEAKKTKAAATTTTTTTSAMLTLVAVDDGSAHAVPRATALDASELLADMLEDDPVGAAGDACLQKYYIIVHFI